MLLLTAGKELAYLWTNKTVFRGLFRRSEWKNSRVRVVQLFVGVLPTRVLNHRAAIVLTFRKPLAKAKYQNPCII